MPGEGNNLKRNGCPPFKRKTWPEDLPLFKRKKEKKNAAQVRPGEYIRKKGKNRSFHLLHKGGGGDEQRGKEENSGGKEGSLLRKRPQRVFLRSPGRGD